MRAPRPLKQYPASVLRRMWWGRVATLAERHTARADEFQKLADRHYRAADMMNAIVLDKCSEE